MVDKKDKEHQQAAEVLAISQGIMKLFERTGVSHVEGAAAVAVAFGTILGSMLGEGQKVSKVEALLDLMMKTVEEVSGIVTEVMKNDRKNKDKGSS